MRCTIVMHLSEVSKKNLLRLDEKQNSPVLKDFYLGRVKDCAVDAYLIHNANSFYANNIKLGEVLLRQCEVVQDGVWNKRFSTFENTFKTDTLLLFLSDNKVKGFISAIPYSYSLSTKFIYYSDAMLSESIQGKGLSSLGFAILYDYLYKTLNVKENEDVISVMASGNLAAFGFFIRKNLFDQLGTTDLDTKSYAALELILKENITNDLRINESDVIERAWGPQKCIHKNLWDQDKVSVLGFPQNVKYSEGDAFLKLFRTNKNTKGLIDQTILSKML